MPKARMNLNMEVENDEQESEDDISDDEYMLCN